MSSLVSGGLLAQTRGLPWIPLTVTDFKIKKIFVTLPLQRIVVLDSSQQISTVARLLGITNLIVGLDRESAKNHEAFPEGYSGCLVGSAENPNIPLIETLDPDLVLTGNITDEMIGQMEAHGLTVASISVFPNQYGGFISFSELSWIVQQISGLNRENDQEVGMEGLRA
ncbi:MAG: hypothetical protein LUQ50_11165 [Methanospirillum sp.]|uniref:hypothetical protein n=1 Tax=Methanospirillum sp. TaxID=45200 RepID=UPI002374A414|nr:hypothetical protein [Methanospirillum sp.]MDD1729614.1 hypothetical protein [Methanospirillum sp.]